MVVLHRGTPLSRNQTKMPSLVTYLMPYHKSFAKWLKEYSGEERKAPEGTWVLGGGIELPCSYFIYGKGGCERKTSGRNLFMGFEQPQQINWQPKAEQRSSLVVTLMEYDTLKSC